jgi:hypothetical protein
MKNILFVLIYLSLAACNHQQNANRKNNSGINYLTEDYSKLKRINVSPDDSLFFIDSLLSEPRFIKLETNNNCLIGKIDKIICDDSLLFVIDQTISHTIFIYDLSGKFKGKISKRGKGPREFLEIMDVAIVPSKKQLALLDVRSRKINYYSYQGEFLSYKKIPFLFTGFTYINTNTIAYYTGTASNYKTPFIDRNMLVVATDKDEILSKRIPLTHNQINSSFSFETKFAPLWKFGNQVIFNPRYSDTLFRVGRDTLFGEYYFNMNGKNIPYDKKANLDDKMFRELTKKYSFLNGNVIDLKDYLYAAMATPTGYHHIFYSKRTRKTISGYNFKMRGPFYSFFDAPSARFGENTIIVIKEPQEITMHKKNIELDVLWKKNKKILELFKNLKETDNPVLLFYPIKDF